MDIDFITGQINWLVLAIAVGWFASIGIWSPWKDKGKFMDATLKYNPKWQCVLLAAIGYGLSGLGGTIAGWFTDGRTWILDTILGGAGWALGGSVGVVAVAVFGTYIWLDYLAPGGAEPEHGKQIAHMILWADSLMLYPLLNLLLGSLSLWTILFGYLAVWFFNVKFRGKKRASTPAAATTR